MDLQILRSFQLQSIELTISDLTRSIAFYQNIVGFTVLEKQEDSAVLGTPDQTALLRLHADSNAATPLKNMAGLYHFAILVPERKDLASFLQHILDKRYPLVGASDHGFSEAIYLEDPDGIGIEVYADRERSKWQRLDGELPVTADPLHVRDLLQSAVKWDGFADGTSIGHLHFHVSSIAEARQFYVEQLGFSPTITLGNQVLFVAAEGYHHHIGLNTWHGEGASLPEPGMIGLREVTANIGRRDFETLVHQGTLGSDGKTTDPFGVTYYFQV
ncbi:VOC family protein [Virgibacillus senegalensis]|uniref:VOC family protein n=1 Tax=Virgibacillus senegalensis TaxID=1499679 RepID=UPI00069EC0DE|nr:VOC family protein [Virgibacillus senegalensis]